MALLCAATVGLHYLTINWVGAHIGPQRAAAPARVPATIKAQLHAPVSERALSAVAARQPASPVRKRRPTPAVAPQALAAPGPAAADAVGQASGAPEPDLVVPIPAAQRGAVETVPDVESAQLAETIKVPEPPVAPPEPGMRRYKVSPPPSAELALDLHRIDADGTVWNGVAAMSWKQDSGRYTMKVEAGISMIVTRVNLLVLTSEGAIDEAGIAPVTATEKRRGRSLTATHFNRDAGRITFSASERSFPLAPGAQDKATLPLQLAAIARADAGQLDGEIEIMVGEDREASLFRFVIVGQEEIETGLGKLQTWHLSRPPRPGSYKSKLDVWLAPEREWYPVRIRNTEASGAVTTQSVSKIVLTDSGS